MIDRGEKVYHATHPESVLPWQTLQYGKPWNIRNLIIGGQRKKKSEKNAYPDISYKLD